MNTCFKSLNYFLFLMSGIILANLAEYPITIYESKHYSEPRNYGFVNTPMRSAHGVEVRKLIDFEMCENIDNRYMPSPNYLCHPDDKFNWIYAYMIEDYSFSNLWVVTSLLFFNSMCVILFA